MSSTRVRHGDEDLLDHWLTRQKTAIGKHALSFLVEKDGIRDDLLDELRQMVRSHYVAPEVIARRLEEHGAPTTAALLKEILPTTKKARSGDLGEVLATEIAERHLSYRVPIRRLRWKDGRNMALRGDDIVAVKRDPKGQLELLKGESKSRASLKTAVINEAAEALDRDRGRPTRHTVLFVAERLREKGEDDLARELEEAVLQSFRAHRAEHLLFALSGNNPEKLLSDHLKACARNEHRRHAVGVRIKDHAKFIENLFSGM